MIATQFACHRLVKLESFLFNYSVTWVGSLRRTPGLKCMPLLPGVRTFDVAFARDGQVVLVRNDFSCGEVAI